MGKNRLEEKLLNNSEDKVKTDQRNQPAKNFKLFYPGAHCVQNSCTSQNKQNIRQQSCGNVVQPKTEVNQTPAGSNFDKRYQKKKRIHNPSLNGEVILSSIVNKENNQTKKNN